MTNENYAAQPPPDPSPGYEWPAPSSGYGPSSQPSGYGPSAQPQRVVRLQSGRFPGPALAGVGRRIAGFAIDVVGGIAAIFLIQVPLILIFDPATAADWLAPVFIVGALVIYLAITVAAIGRSGKSLGKLVLGMRVVDTRTLGAIGIGRALLHGIIAVPLSFSWIWILLMILSTTVFDKSGFLQGWHDKAARSIELDGRAGVDPAMVDGPHPPVVRFA